MLTLGRLSHIACAAFLVGMIAPATAAEIEQPGARELQAMMDDVFSLRTMRACMQVAARQGPMALARVRQSAANQRELWCWRGHDRSCSFTATEVDPYTHRRVSVDIKVVGETVNMSSGVQVLYGSQPKAREAAALGACRSSS